MLTDVRFTVGPQAEAAGIVPGDHIVAIYGLPLPDVDAGRPRQALGRSMPTTPPISRWAICSSAPTMPTFRLTVRDPDGQVRDVTVTTGEQHIDAGARALGIFAQRCSSFIDLLHVLSYPFLLWAAWLLHRRNARDAVSSVLSLAVLLTIAAEQPSSIFLSYIGSPALAQRRAFYDLGNMLPARRHPAVPARQSVVARIVVPDRLAADAVVPPRRRSTRPSSSAS